LDGAAWIRLKPWRGESTVRKKRSKNTALPTVRKVPEDSKNTQEMVEPRVVRAEIAGYACADHRGFPAPGKTVANWSILRYDR
jgi:hypothetical protein